MLASGDGNTADFGLAVGATPGFPGPGDGEPPRTKGLLRRTDMVGRSWGPYRATSLYNTRRLKHDRFRVDMRMYARRVKSWIAAQHAPSNLDA
jgi:hypothetical protein